MSNFNWPTANFAQHEQKPSEVAHQCLVHWNVAVRTVTGKDSFYSLSQEHDFTAPTTRLQYRHNYLRLRQQLTDTVKGTPRAQLNREEFNVTYQFLSLMSFVQAAWTLDERRLTRNRNRLPAA